MPDFTVYGTFDEVVTSFKPEVQAIARAIRSVITGIHKDVIEVAWPRQKIASYGVGPRKMSEHYAYIAPQGNYVNLGFYHGVALFDPAQLLEGGGQRLRHIKIRSGGDVRKNEIRALLEAALAERKKAMTTT